MNLKKTLLGILLLLSLGLLAQENKILETKGIIKNIELKRSGKTVKEFATVNFVTQKGDSIETYVELLRIPFLGSFKNINDEITINYNIENPALAETNAGSFISKYGMYILIFLGVIFSLRTYLKARKQTN